MSDRNVLGGELELCGKDPLTGFYRDGVAAPVPKTAEVTRSAQ